MAASRLAAALAVSAIVLLAVPAVAWAGESQCGGLRECTAVVGEVGGDRPPSEPPSEPSVSQPPNSERIVGPLASLPGADEAPPRGNTTVLRAATVLVALGIIAATAGLALALQGRRPAASR
ncbi:MAG: hypothetical protein ACOCUN_02775 [Jiangellaceae bacterium]